MDIETQVALEIRLEEIRDHMKDDFFKEYALDEIETLIGEVRAGHIVPF